MYLKHWTTFIRIYGDHLHENFVLYIYVVIHSKDISYIHIGYNWLRIYEWRAYIIRTNKKYTVDCNCELSNCSLPLLHEPRYLDVSSILFCTTIDVLLYIFDCSNIFIKIWFFRICIHCNQTVSYVRPNILYNTTWAPLS